MNDNAECNRESIFIHALNLLDDHVSFILATIQRGSVEGRKFPRKKKFKSRGWRDILLLEEIHRGRR